MHVESLAVCPTASSSKDNGNSEDITTNEATNVSPHIQSGPDASEANQSRSSTISMTILPSPNEDGRTEIPQKTHLILPLKYEGYLENIKPPNYAARTPLCHQRLTDASHARAASSPTPLVVVVDTFELRFALIRRSIQATCLWQCPATSGARLPATVDDDELTYLDN
ncbi:hypothetical protein EDD15DRAFT_2198454 [Pisolithus albus]|nr:hypothetical protein EDD15DRAFT_2198454 [Pisolithus albus]